MIAKPTLLDSGAYDYDNTIQCAAAALKRWGGLDHVEFKTNEALGKEAEQTKGGFNLSYLRSKTTGSTRRIFRSQFPRNDKVGTW